MWQKSETMIGHSLFVGIGLYEILKFESAYGSSRDSKLFNCPAVAGDRRRAGTSMPDSHNHAMTLLFYFIPKVGIIIKIGPDFISDNPCRVREFFR